MWFDKYYKKSIHKIRTLKIKLTITQYNEMAKEYNLLSAESLKCVSGQNFESFLRMVKSNRI